MEKNALEDKLLATSSKIKFNEPLAQYTTFRVGGCADYFIEVKSLDELKTVLMISKEMQIPFFVLGAGSNVLISDKGISGIVIRLKGEFCRIDFLEQEDTCILTAGAGAMLQSAIKQSVDRSYSGLEALAGIPGTIGGALITNAGTSAGEIGDLVQEVDIIEYSCNVKTLKKKEIKFQYRSSSLEGYIILYAKLLLKKKPKEIIIKRLTQNLLHRSKTQPLGHFNAGSIFKNPKNGYAGKLIEQAGLKGLRIGDAKVSNQHANFIINTGNATAEDIRKLIFEVQRRVRERFGINLDIELRIIGNS